MSNLYCFSSFLAFFLAFLVSFLLFSITEGLMPTHVDLFVFSDIFCSSLQHVWYFIKDYALLSRFIFNLIDIQCRCESALNIEFACVVFFALSEHSYAFALQHSSNDASMTSRFIIAKT